MKADNPEAFAASIGAVLAEYPLGLVQECCDPRTGAARKIEFLSIRALTEWLDHRLEFHQVLARHVPRPQLAGPAPKVYSDEHRGAMLARLAALFRGMWKGGADPILRLRREARRKADAQLMSDRARALADLQGAE